MPRDLSEVPGNPSYALRQNYEQLMAIPDPEDLKATAIKIVQPFIGRGLSEKNYRKFLQSLGQKRNLTQMQKYVSDYILAGAGLKVVENEEDAIASLLTEDIDSSIELTPDQEKLKQLIENYGFKVALG